MHTWAKHSHTAACSARLVVQCSFAHCALCLPVMLLTSLQLPSMHDVRLVSLLGILMSAAYCIIAIVMSAKVHPTNVSYNPAAVSRTPIERVMGIFNAMTTIFFTYGGHNVALEIQATIPTGGKHPLTTVPVMMLGVNVTFIVTGALAIVATCD